MFHLYGKMNGTSGLSGGKSNGTVLSTGNVSKNKETPSEVFLLSRFTEITGISLYHLL